MVNVWRSCVVRLFLHNSCFSFPLSSPFPRFYRPNSRFASKRTSYRVEIKLVFGKMATYRYCMCADVCVNVQKPGFNNTEKICFPQLSRAAGVFGENMKMPVCVNLLLQFSCRAVSHLFALQQHCTCTWKPGVRLICLECACMSVKDVQ